ncbi:MAG: PASTA domain-containing protein [Clostridia bacterium]|nr:PASTA domain-containing protein [Clostridia bacterium]
MDENQKRKTGKKNPAPDRKSLAPDRGMLLRVFAVLGLVCLVALPYLIYQLAKVQILEHESWQSRAIRQQTRSVTLLPVRGVIYDANMNEVAVSTVTEHICFAPANMRRDYANVKSAETREKMVREDEEKISMICRELSEVLDLDYDLLMAKAAKSDTYYQVVARNVEKDKTDVIRAFISENKISGVDFYPSSVRDYPYGSFGSAVIGFTNADGEGTYGVERTYDPILSGQAGRIISARNSAGEAMPFSYEQYLDAEDGHGVVLTLDHTVQDVLMKYLETAAIDNDAAGATGVVLNVKTGAVIGMGSYPDYDLNSPRSLSEEDEAEIALLPTEEQNEARLTKLYESWRNKAVSEAYEPGSTFKTVTAAIALEGGTSRLSDTYYCGGSIHVAGWNIGCWKHAGHGSLDFTGAVMGSCNVAFIQIGQSIGAANFYRGVESFGLTSKTGIDLPGESSGIFFNESTFGDSASNLAVASFGQRFKITPIQLITAVAGIANGGMEMKPHVAAAYTDGEGNVTESVEPEVLRQIVSKETSSTLCSILEKVVSKGTGRNAYVAGYRVGGKTGTSEKNAAGTEQDYIASFMGIAPCDDPAYAVLILIDEPKGSLYQGGQIAAPVVGRVFGEILPYLGVEPVYTKEELSTLQVTVPKVTRMSQSDALARVKAAGLDAEIVGEGGYVTSQLPAYGSIISNRTKVVLYCGEEVPEETAEVPSVIGLSYPAAVKRLEDAGFYMHATGTVQTVVGDSVRAKRQSAEPGSMALKGSVITVEFLDGNTYETGE